MRKISLRGFTLIELLVVITIIAVLAGLTLGVSGNVRQKAAVSRARVEIAAIETALERYKIDNGDYPDGQAVTVSNKNAVFFENLSDDGNPSNYKTSGKSLFLALMGRATYSATLTTGQVQYLELKQSQTETSGASYIIDPFGYAYGYYYNPIGIGGTNPDPSRKSLFNYVVPDIWSTAGEKTSSTSIPPKKIDNPYNTDGSLKNPITEDMSRYLRWVTNWGSRQ